MWNLKRNDTNEFTYKTERDSQTQKMNSWLSVGRHSHGLWEGHAHTAIFNGLCGTWSSAQCYMPAWMGGCLRENGYMYMHLCG